MTGSCVVFACIIMLMNVVQGAQREYISSPTSPTRHILYIYIISKQCRASHFEPLFNMQCRYPETKPTVTYTQGNAAARNPSASLAVRGSDIRLSFKPRQQACSSSPGESTFARALHSLSSPIDTVYCKRRAYGWQLRVWMSDIFLYGLEAEC